MPMPRAAFTPHWRAIALALCAALPLPAVAQDDDAAPEAARPAPQPAFVLSPDGSLVIDTRARLAWPRCVEGMSWNGSACSGAPRLLNHGEAQALAHKRWQAEGVRWRLPRVNELRRLVNRQTQPPSVDQRLFPAMPRDWIWTGTASVNVNTVNPYSYGNVARGGMGESSLNVRQNWAVNMASGEANGAMGRATKLYVQLVRPAP